MTYPNGETVNFDYHPQGTLESAAGESTYVQSTAYDAAGQTGDGARKCGHDASSVV